jgi:hypothetical protein
MPYKNSDDQRAAWRRHYANTDNKLAIKAAVAVRKQAAKEYVLSVKQRSHCVDCGNTDWRVLDFDHLPGFEKSLNLAAAGSQGWSVARIDLEMAKCEIVCANCHRIRTHERRGVTGV